MNHVRRMTTTVVHTRSTSVSDIIDIKYDLSIVLCLVTHTLSHDAYTTRYRFVFVCFRTRNNRLRRFSNFNGLRNGIPGASFRDPMDEYLSFAVFSVALYGSGPTSPYAYIKSYVSKARKLLDRF